MPGWLQWTMLVVVMLLMFSSKDYSGAIGRLAGEIEDLEEKINDLESRIDDIENTVESKNDDVDDYDYE